MPSTYTLISSNVLGSSAASVTFSAIPSTYTDLVVRLSLRNDRAVTDGTFIMTVNNNTSSIYSYTYVQGNGSAASSARSSAGTSLTDFTLVGSSATSNTFSSLEIYIPSYTASQNKPISTFGASETNAAAIKLNAIASLAATTAAISSIEIANNSTWQFVSGSSFYLYGISKS